MARKYWYVVVTVGGWGVKLEGQSIEMTYTLQSDAINYAAAQARSHHERTGENTGIRVQGEGGQFRDERTYGDDPHPPRG